jgi:hypothetical protein
MKKRLWFPFHLAAQVRRVLTRPQIVIVAATFIVLMEILWATCAYFDVYGNLPLIMLSTRDRAVVVLMGAFGWFRVFWFHPLFNTEYRNWLRASPWQKGDALPLGTVHPCVGDIIVVAFLALLLADPRTVTHSDFLRTTPLMGLAMYAISHASVVPATVWLTQPRAFAYVAFLLIAAAMRLGQVWAPLLPLMLLAGWAVACKGLSDSWHLFPWDETIHWGGRIKRRWQTMNSQGVGLLGKETGPDRVPVSELGWPFATLSPWTPSTVIGKRERLLMAALLSFWLHAILSIFSQKELAQGGAATFLVFVVTFLAIGRLAMIGGNHAPPLNLAGRLFLFRWIIPGHDRAAVPALTIAATALGTAAAGHFLCELSLPVLVSLVLMSTLAVFILVGPDATTWRLTAPCRIHHGLLNKQTYDQLT